MFPCLVADSACEIGNSFNDAKEQPYCTFPRGQSGMNISVSTQQPIFEAAFRLRNGVSAPSEVRFLGVDDLPELIAFRERIFSGLPDIDAYFPEDPEFVGWHLAERGRTLGVLCRGRLMACAVIGIPLTGMPSFAADVPDLGIDPLLAAHMCSCMVDRELRGQGVQRLLVSMRVLLAVGLGRPHLLTRVAVVNHVSLANMLGCGFLLRRIIVMHGTRLRYVLHRDLTAVPQRWDIADAVAVPVADVERQRLALADGLAGVAMTGPMDDCQILFIQLEREPGPCRGVRSSSILTPPVS